MILDYYHITVHSLVCNKLRIGFVEFVCTYTQKHKTSPSKRTGHEVALLFDVELVRNLVAHGDARERK